MKYLLIVLLLPLISLAQQPSKEIIWNELTKDKNIVLEQDAEGSYALNNFPFKTKFENKIDVVNTFSYEEDGKQISFTPYGVKLRDNKGTFFPAPKVRATKLGNKNNSDSVAYVGGMGTGISILNEVTKAGYCKIIKIDNNKVFGRLQGIDSVELIFEIKNLTFDSLQWDKQSTKIFKTEQRLSELSYLGAGTMWDADTFLIVPLKFYAENGKMFVSKIIPVSFLEEDRPVYTDIAITFGSQVAIVNTTTAPSSFEVVAVESNKYVVLYRASDYILGRVVTVSGTTASLGAETTLYTFISPFRALEDAFMCATTSQGHKRFCLLYSEFDGDNSTRNLHAKMFYIDGSTINLIFTHTNLIYDIDQNSVNGDYMNSGHIVITATTPYPSMLAYGYTIGTSSLSYMSSCSSEGSFSSTQFVTLKDEYSYPNKGVFVYWNNGDLLAKAISLEWSGSYYYLVCGATYGIAGSTSLSDIWLNNINGTQFIVQWKNSTASTTSFRIGTVSSVTTISLGSSYDAPYNVYDNNFGVMKGGSSLIYVAPGNDSNRAYYAAISGTTITFDNTPYIYDNTSVNGSLKVASSNPTEFLLMFRDAGDGYEKVVVGTIPAAGKKINGVTYVKWNNSTITKWNNQ